MSLIEKNAIWITALFYIFAGMSHFIFHDFLIQILPPEIVQESLVIYLTGLVEVILGFMLLSSQYRKLAAWLIMFMLCGYLWVHFYMLLEHEKFTANFNLTQYTAMPILFYYARIGLQFVMIYWIYAFTKD